MDTPRQSLLGAMFAQVTALTAYTLRTTPGLVLITLGSGISLLGHPWWGLAAAATGAFIYREQCGRTPFANCARCHGTGHHQKPRRILRTGTVRRCTWCRGKGVRIRWGRAVMNAYRRATHTSRTTPDAATTALPARQAGPVSYAEALQRTNRVTSSEE